MLEAILPREHHHATAGNGETSLCRDIILGCWPLIYIQQKQGYRREALAGADASRAASLAVVF